MRNTRQHLLSRLVPAALLLLSAGTRGGTEPLLQSHESIRRQVHGFLMRNIPAAGAEVEIHVQGPDPRLRLSRCEEPLEVFLPPATALTGRVTAGVRCPGAQRWSLYLPARVSLFEQVVVVRRGLERGADIPRSALVLERRDLARESRGYFLDIEQVAGQQAQRRIGRGTVVNPTMVTSPLNVRRGALVRIVSRIAGIEVRTRGKALDHGSLGERIRVENLSSGRELEARVVSAGTVRVDI